MRHRKRGRKLGRNSSHRKAMLRNMVTSLFRHEQIETTDAKAKALRPLAEKMITLAKRGDLHARRQVLSYMRDKAVTHRLFEDLKDRYLERQGGYLRIVKKDTRKGDGAPISVIQLLPPDEKKKVSKKKGKKTKITKITSRKPKKKAAIKKEAEKTEKNGDKLPPNASAETDKEKAKEE